MLDNNFFILLCEWMDSRIKIAGKWKSGQLLQDIDISYYSSGFPAVCRFAVSSKCIADLLPDH